MADGGGIGEAGGITVRAGGIDVGARGFAAAMAGLLEMDGRSTYHEVMNFTSRN
jgi:hypothetical protein